MKPCKRRPALTSVADVIGADNLHDLALWGRRYDATVVALHLIICAPLFTPSPRGSAGDAAPKVGLTRHFAARRVRLADGRNRMLDNRMQCMPGDEVWVAGERSRPGSKNTMSNLPSDTTTKTLAATSKAG
jgi:hypothetical protein